ncbi:hypothetical protein Hanom_Chr12g01168061 [Helianthus anomalus]
MPHGESIAIKILPRGKRICGERLPHAAKMKDRGKWWDLVSSQPIMFFKWFGGTHPLCFFGKMSE